MPYFAVAGPAGAVPRADRWRGAGVVRLEGAVNRAAEGRAGAVAGLTDRAVPDSHLWRKP